MQSKTLKMLLLTMCLVPLVILLALFVMGQLSQSGSAPGLAEGKLYPCPDKPNCLCSEFKLDSPHYIPPLTFQPQNRNQAWHDIQATITQLGGTLVEVGDDYLAATFTSALFRFVDDVEARLDPLSGIIHLRSSSRVGHSDLGANRARVISIRTLFLKKRQQHD